MKKPLILILAIIGLVLLLSLSSINSIPAQDEAVKAAWAQVENQYKRRADLVPNLVSTVKGYAKHEKDTLTEVTEARAKATQITLSPEMLNDPKALEQFEKAQGRLRSALSRLLAVSERYPDLKANQNFLALQSQLEGTENRISVARRDYIGAVQQYNTTIRTFPGMIWARLLYNAQPKQTFSAPEGSDAAPAVQF